MRKRKEQTSTISIKEILVITEEVRFTEEKEAGGKGRVLGL